ncbi:MULTISPECIES: hypothetical protein [Streptomyces]|uniref:hypothetical protein n=1 Tax=Streptomyces TaxID=1883 RepID=UPI000E0755EE|nr:MULTISPECIES: hypothetical protein [Streptomyces]MBT3077580.1 hypothetical protein [Streptomyces sp. COG21]MBT3084425.1 hypothetical protein [Streptomyces sp. COG20]MBT3086997.1 hypothetical protein [Streptomyces sp. CYG21]MBT3098751.1 hypothetical protein [Streptomyces sp. CBG30]MBT3103625.1 hypothetical protein [Streptomyces sp. COG19]
MNIVDLAWQVLVVLGYVALVFTPGLLVAAGFHYAKRTVARRAWAATCRTIAAEYQQEQPLLDDVAHIVNTYADRITPLYGKGE